MADLAPSAVPTVMTSEAFTDYDVPGSPYFVYVHGPSGRVRGEGTGPDWEQVRSLLSQATVDAGLTTALADQQVAKPDADQAREERIDRAALGRRRPARRPEPLRCRGPGGRGGRGGEYRHDHDHDHPHG
ncbi:MAG: hypothetical protein R2702_17945 [Acidimicrobiales bacterium]